jgi:hypothetical protein
LVKDQVLEYTPEVEVPPGFENVIKNEIVKDKDINENKDKDDYLN